MTLDLVIFDCDGVLVDSEPIVNRVLARLLAREGLVMPIDEIDREFLGLSWDAGVEILEARLGRPLSAGFLARVRAETFAAFRRELRPIPGIAEALASIAHPVCVASSGEPDKIRLTLGLTGLLARFEGRVFSAADVARGKPHPDLFLHAAKRCGARPGACVVVEDSLPGVTGARAAGMRVLAYSPARLEARGWDDAFRDAGARLFRDMAGLPALLDGEAAAGAKKMPGPKTRQV